MKNIYAILACLIAVTLAVIPPIDFVIMNPQGKYWLWMVMLCACAGIGTLFIKTDWVVKVIAVDGLVNCFYSSLPYVSFTSYVSLVLCCYLYIMASRITDWGIIFKGLQVVVLLDLLIFLMQAIHHDPLLNFGLRDVRHFGTLGQHMQMASFGVVISSLLISFMSINFIVPFLFAFFCHSSWGFLSAGVGMAIMTLKYNKYCALVFVCLLVISALAWSLHEHKVTTISGRLPVWQKSIHLANEHPWVGWGIGSFKDLFLPISRMTSQWKEAHNFILQLCFEVGYLRTGALLLGLGWLCWSLFKRNQWLLLSGLSMLLTDALVHFPDRMLQTVPMLVLFFAYTKCTLKRVT